MSHNSQDQPLHCSECKGDVILSHGEYVCKKCGLVVMQEYVVPSYQYPNQQSETQFRKKTAELGERLSIVDGLGSYIDYPRSNYFSDIRGSKIDINNQSLYKRLKYHYSLRSRRFNSETEYRILRILNRVISLLQLSTEIKERAAYFYRKIRGYKDKKYTNNVLLLAVCIVTAIREKGPKSPHTINDIATVFQELGHRINTRSIVREMLNLRVELNLRQNRRESKDYFYRIISDICNSNIVHKRLQSLGEDLTWYRRVLTTKTFELYDNGVAEEIGGRNPYIFAVSVVYAADKAIGRERGRKSVLTQRIIAKITRVAEFSIRDHFCAVLKARL